MKSKNIFKGILATAVLGLTVQACKYEPPVEPALVPNKGTADFSKYVAIGNSLTAGFADNALYGEVQRNSFPALMAESFKEVGGGAFNQPDINSEVGFSGLAGATPLGRLRLINPGPCDMSTALQGQFKRGISPRPIVPGEIPTAYSGNKQALNNFGVPGVSLPGSFSPLLAQNPLYARFASAPGTSSLIQDAANAKGTFFTMWLGNNDALGYATSGGTGTLTPAPQFQALFNLALDSMLNATPNTKGLVATIPDVTSIPFFAAVTNNIRPFALDSATAAQLNGLYQMNGLGNPGFRPGNVNYFTIVTGTGVRQYLPEKDFFVLNTPTDSLGTGGYDACDPANPAKQRAGWGVMRPIPNNFVLDSTEVMIVRASISEYNNIINAAVNARNVSATRVALFDANKFLADFSRFGGTYNGVRVNASLPFGGAFSLDGVHLTPRGNAIVATEMLKTIEKTFGATLRKPDISKYRGNIIP